MKSMISRSAFRCLAAALLISLTVSLLGSPNSASAAAAGVEQAPPNTALPENLFVRDPPPNPSDVAAVRATAEQGGRVVIKGRIGGAPAPIGDNRAIFLVTDYQLPTCNPGCGCPTPWDACCAPRQTVLNNVATVQVVDGSGKPLKTDLRGINGLRPSADVAVQGKVAKKDKNLLLINAEQIYVRPAPVGGEK
ncbi:MAG: hypothetical protein V2B18_10945 [Pseudomonadota bacterium]